MNRPFNNSVSVQTAGGPVVVNNRSTFAYQFTNLGDVIGYVNNMIVYPGVPGTSLGDTRTVAGHDGDIYKGVIEIKFAAGGTPKMEIVQLFYTDVD